MNKFLVIVTVLVACGPAAYEDILLRSLRCCKDVTFLPTNDDSQIVENQSWFIWMPGSAEPNVDDCDEVKKTEEEYSAIMRANEETARSLKFSYTDNLIPSSSGDNSHYVEGQSRYIWMPDGNGAPHLVDLQETGVPLMEERNAADTEYWLYTRKNPNIAQEIVFRYPESIHRSTFMPSRPIKVLVHGWLSDGYDDFNSIIRSTFLDVHDVNIIVVDWRNLAKSGYGTAVEAVPEVGRNIAVFLSWLIMTSGSSWNNVHLVGFSLGAHIAGSAGRFAGGRPARVTGLDPAGPLFHGNPHNLSPFDAQYVEAIHTDGDRLGHFGNLGQVDFYANGGRNPQPGCYISTCSHSRVVALFAATIRFDHLIGYKCNNINEAERVACRGEPLKMGNANLTKHGNGIYAVKTVGFWPY